MKMNTFEKVVWFYAIFQYNLGQVRLCKLKPTNVQTLNIKVFYNFEDRTWAASKNLINSVCQNYQSFGDKMTVEFILTSHLIIVDDDPGITPPYAACEFPYHCADELTEICTEILSGNPLGYICCTDGYENCLAQYNINPDDIKKCVDHGFGTNAGETMYNNNNKMLDPNVKKGDLPALVFNDQEYNKCTDNHGYANFVDTCCKLYQPDCAPKPPC